jgi:CelD/BcsL family acetyltransferase involved in cellulose biosynthesis
VTSSRWEIIEYRGREGVEKLAPDWRRLYSQMPDRSRYHAHEACLAFLDNLCAAPDDFRCLALSDGQRIRAICPLEATEKSLGRRLPVWAVPWHLHWLVADVIGPEDEARQALLPELTSFLGSRSGSRPVLVLGPLPETSVLWRGLERLRASSVCVESSMPSCYFDCRLPYDELMSRLTKHFRRNLRSHQRKLDALEGVRFVTVTSEEGLDVALDDFLAVEASGWKGPSGTGSAIALHPEIMAFYRDLAGELTGEEDRCEVNAIYIGSECVASQFCVRTGSEYTVLKIGYSEAHARLGPGQLLLQHTLERCCCDPAVTRLDLVSDSSWCNDWQTDLVPMRKAYIGLGGLGGRAPIALLQFRFGPARRAARWARAKRSAADGPPTGRACVQQPGPSGTPPDET